MAKSGLVLDELFAKHSTCFGHPERSERIHAISEALQNAGLTEKCLRVEPEKTDSAWIHRNHSPDYIKRLHEACLAGQGFIDSPDSSISKESFEIAEFAVGGSLGLVDRVMQGSINNGLAIVRPPGHHAEYDESMGFCLFNSIAIAARYLLEFHQLSRVLILDWDVHHGNGTQHSFDFDPRVFYCSFHGHPDTLYPGTGYAEEIGNGKGQGTTLNLPMIPGSGDIEYREAFSEHFVPAVEAFKPEFILVSAGFDAHQDDAISQIRLNDQSFEWLSKETLKLADEFAGGRLVSLLEGGYELDALGRSVAIHLNSLLEA